MEALLLILAIVLSSVLFPIGFLLGICYSGRAKYLYHIALGIDQLGNVVCAKLFNIVLIRGHKFGNPDETISSVIGKNKLSGTLTTAGKLLDKLLDAIDRNHSIKAIEA